MGEGVRNKSSLVSQSVAGEMVCNGYLVMRKGIYMLDNRIYTFLMLCETMNYRKTAELLNMTQPAVTQHIHYLERIYNVKLFEYKNKILSMTESGRELENYSRSIVYNEVAFQKEIAKVQKKRISIGATKTIGEYELDEITDYFLNDHGIELNILIDNTTALIKRLNNFELDFLLVEGYFEKNKYDYKLLKNSEMVGICSKEHRFANKLVEITDLFGENLILREVGSGTRKVLENFLEENNYSLESFAKTTTISSFSLIENIVEKDYGVSFVYESIPRQNEKISTFRIENRILKHEYNYVFLKNSNVRVVIEKMEKNIHTE